MPTNAETNVSQTVQAPPHQRSSIRIQHASIVNNNDHINHSESAPSPINHNQYSLFSSLHGHSNVANHPQYQPREEENKENDLIHEYATPSETTKPQQLQQEQHKGQQLCLKFQPQRNCKPLSLIPKTKPIENNRVDNGSNINDAQQHQLHNRIIVIRIKTPIVSNLPHYRSSVEDQTYRRNDDNNRPPFPNDTSSCISSLSADESHDESSDLPNIVHISPPAQTMYNKLNPNCHCHDLESGIHPIGEEQVVNSIYIPHHHQFCKNKSPLRTLPSRRGEISPHQPTNLSLEKSKTLFLESVIGERNAVQSGGGEVETRRSQYNRQGSIRPLDQNFLPSYHQKTIFSHSKMQRHKRMHSPMLYDFTKRDNKNSIYNSTQSYSTMTKHRRKSKKVLPRYESSSCVRTISTSTSFMSLASVSLSLSEYGGNRQNNDQLAGEGSNSITGASYGMGKRRRRREAKDELKYLIKKVIPASLKRTKVLFMKKKRYILKRSSGCLT